MLLLAFWPEQLMSPLSAARNPTESCLGVLKTLPTCLSHAPSDHPVVGLAESPSPTRLTTTTQGEIDQPRLFPRWDYFQKRNLPRDKSYQEWGGGNSILGPCGKSWFLALPTHQDSREIRCRRKGHPSFMAPTSGHLFRESVSVLSGTQSLWTGQRWSTREDPSRDKALPGPTPHLLRASFSQHIKWAWTSNPKRKETKPKWGLRQPLQADSIPHLPQPSPQACPLLGRARGRLISPKVVTEQFSKLHENRKQTENQIHQSLSLKNSLAGRSNVLTISCCFKSF